MVIKKVNSTKTAQVQSRQQQQALEICAATARALSNEPQLHYRGDRLYRGNIPLLTSMHRIYVFPKRIATSQLNAAISMLFHCGCNTLIAPCINSSALKNLLLDFCLSSSNSSASKLSLPIPCRAWRPISNMPSCAGQSNFTNPV